VLAGNGQSYLQGIKDAQARETAARQQLARQSERAARTEQLAAENERLRALLDLQPALQRVTVGNCRLRVQILCYGRQQLLLRCEGLAAAGSEAAAAAAAAGSGAAAAAAAGTAASVPEASGWTAVAR
jgi:hypothetical protein